MTPDPTRSRSYEPEIAVLFVLFSVFAGLSCLFSHGATDDNDHAYRVMLSTIGIVLGPFVGALNRGGMSSCIELGLVLLPWGGGPLTLAILSQLACWPRSPMLRLTLWTIGWIAWFTTGIVSLGYALG